MRRSVRLRLTLYYGSIVFLSGAVLLTLTFVLVQQSLTSDLAQLDRAVMRRVLSELVIEPGDRAVFPGFVPDSEELSGRAFTAAQRSALAEALERLRLQAAVALGLTTAASLVTGWVMAGRVLRPLSRITLATRQLSEQTLHERIELGGPDDELKELADSLDGLLARLDAAFAAQRDFVANASHELRTPLAIIRAELDVTLIDPNASVAELRDMAEAIRTATHRSERLVDSLLLLANPGGPALDGRTVDLADALLDALADVERKCLDLRLRVSVAASPAVVTGDPVLLGRLVGNLVDNAVLHNEPAGWVVAETGMEADRPVIRISNGGSVLDAVDVGTLFERFTRLERPRVRGHGFGLGLSIVETIASAHGASVRARGLEEGGLEITVVFPAPVATVEEPGGRALPASPGSADTQDAGPTSVGRRVWPPRSPSHW